MQKCKHVINIARTLACKARNLNTLARKHATIQSSRVRKHSKHVICQTRHKYFNVANRTLQLYWE